MISFFNLFWLKLIMQWIPSYLKKTRVKFLGKNGLISLELKKISSLSPEEKKTLGKQLNEFKNILLKKINIKKKFR